MNDAEINYKHTVATCKVPPGWEIVDPSQCDSTVDISSLQFLDGERVWVDYTTHYAEGNFPALWAAGATVVIRPAPVPVEPPRPSFLPPPLPSQVVETPTTTAPVAAPVIPVVLPTAAPVAAPVIQLPTLTLPVTPAPAPAPVTLPVAPALPVQAPVLPQVPPPVAAPAPSLPNMPLPLPSAVQPLPVAPVATEPAAPVEVEGGMDSAALYLSMNLLYSKAEEIEKLASDMEKRLLKMLFPDGVNEGTQHATLADGTKIKVVGKINRTLDEDALREVLPILRNNGVQVDEVFPVKHTLSLSKFRPLPDNIKLMLAASITEKPGKPVISEK